MFPAKAKVCLAAATPDHDEDHCNSFVNRCCYVCFQAPLATGAVCSFAKRLYGGHEMIQVPERRLILIKHAMPAIQPEKEASSWHLSGAGKASCESLAETLGPYRLSMFVSSAEPKARETATILHDRLNVPLEIAPGFHEHDRTGVPFLDNPSQWNALIERFFAEPDELILGRETATAAQDRFTTVLDAVLMQHGAGNLAVVAHGTVITLFVGLHNKIDKMSFWRALGLPSFVVLKLPSFEIEHVFHSICGGSR